MKLINWIGMLASISLASPASAQISQINFTEDFQPSSYVDLNQGYYICRISNPRDLLARLMSIKDDRTRRQVAGQAGCPFNMTAKPGPKFKVLAELGTICAEPQIVQDTNALGQQFSTKICGREGHQLLVSRAGRQLTVLMITNDTDYD